MLPKGKNPRVTKTNTFLKQKKPFCMIHCVYPPICSDMQEKKSVTLCPSNDKVLYITNVGP